MNKLRDDAKLFGALYAILDFESTFETPDWANAARKCLDEFDAHLARSTPGAPAPTPALCTHPAIDIDGLCEACRDKVALAVPVEFARRVAEIDRAAATLPAVTPEPRALMAKLLKFTEYVCDIANEMDIVQPEDEEAEGGVLAEARAYIEGAAPPAGHRFTLGPNAPRSFLAVIAEAARRVKDARDGEAGDVAEPGRLRLAAIED